MSIPHLYYMKLWHGQYVVREMMHNPVSFIDVGPQVCSTATARPVTHKFAGAVTKRLVHCACQFPWYVKLMMMCRITQKKGNSQWSHSRAGKREKTEEYMILNVYSTHESGVIKTYR